MPDILPTGQDNAPQGPLVVALAYDGLCTFEFAIVVEVFGQVRPELGPSWYRFAACTIEDGPLRALGGITVKAEHGLELLAAADLIVVPGWKGPDVPLPPNVAEALVAAHRRGARLASICSGAFALAATGLLDGKRAATHWMYAEALERNHPAIEVDASVLYVEDGRLLTSAGSAAGIDLMLHIVRSDFGPETANSVARRLVLPPHRSGGQAQFVQRPVPSYPSSRFGPLLDRIRAEPGKPWTVRGMASEAAMSERTFFRRFIESTGATPAEWLSAVRVDEARRLLEATQLSIEEIASRSGFGSTEMLRYHFAREMRLSPREYRERFRGALADQRRA